MTCRVQAQSAREQPLLLHLGCGRPRLEGWVNCDFTPGLNVDEAFDVQKAWPFDTNTVSAIYASHLLEHLRDPWTFFREAWSVLRPNGAMTLRLPHGDHRAAWWDLTHIRPWYPENFCLLQPGYAETIGNPQTQGWDAPFGISSVDCRISGEFARLLSWRLGRRLLMPWADHIQNFCEELWVNTFALKDAEAVAAYRRRHPAANVVPARWVMYRHHLERRALRPQEAPGLVPLVDDNAVNGFHAGQQRRIDHGGGS